MRSSDWSSDVCSSDLRAERRVKRVELQLQAIGQPHLDTVAKTQLLDRRGGDIDALLVQLGKFGRPEIERALSQKRDLGPISPQEFSFFSAMTTAAEHRHVHPPGLITIADRTIAEKPTRHAEIGRAHV